MKNLKSFTLLETILVIVIIGIVSASLVNFRRNIQANQDISREALTVFYKEMNSSIKDFQRNRIREDADWITHEVSYLYFNFNNTDTADIKIWNDLVIWNIFIYTWNNELRWHFDWTPLILDQKYSAFQSLKWAEDYSFYTRNQSNWEITSILVANNWKIFEGHLSKVINDSTIRLDESWETLNLWQRIENPLQRLTFDFIFNNNLKQSFEEIQDTNNHTYKFLICWWYWNSNPQPIWIISINAVVQTTNLERCENEKYAWIKCEEFASCE